MSMMKRMLAGLVSATLALSAGPVLAAGKAKHPEGPEGGWSFEGPFGTFDRAALQRGYKVYKNVCASCHGMTLLSFRNLGEEGGPFYGEMVKDKETGAEVFALGSQKHGTPVSAIDNPYVKAIAMDFIVAGELDELGEATERPAIPSDRMPSPYRNEVQARAVNGGAYPPDLSVMAHARHYGPDYLYSLLVGYDYPIPEGLEVPPGQHYNPYFPGDVGDFWSGDKLDKPKGGFLAMADQLTPGRVEYDDGTEATESQMAQDVVTFLAWAADPHMEKRKSLGLRVILFLSIFAVLLYLSYKEVWRRLKEREKLES